ncbi:MAG: hypothetical protein NC434_08960 [Ruminococcus sp.]|nr:hypothetical protein [Ruminococcus sp.]MCM1235017.1 hypothetical protein [Ruminococcus flavefaciens]
MGREVYVLGLWECFGERTICGVYTSKKKLLEDYQKVMEGDVRCWPHTDDLREPAIYRFYENEFIGETPEWNDDKLYIADHEHEISIQELQKEMETDKTEDEKHE